MLIIKAKVNQYMKAGVAQFVYSVKSDSTDPKIVEKELAAYKAACGTYYREDDQSKEPLFFSQRVCKPGAELKEAKNGRYTALTEDLEAMVEAKEGLKSREIAKLQAATEFFGMSKQELLQTMFG